MSLPAERYAILCGNGRFPLLALEQARLLGHEIVAIGIKGEAGPEIEPLAATTHWISVAQLGKLIDILHREKITLAIFAGQVKHVSLFSGLTPDWRLAKLLFSLEHRNTDALIGGVIEELRKEGIEVADSTALLKPLLAGEGVLTRRGPTADEEKEIRYGRRIAAALSGFDLGQSVAISERACVALEAMEGTDAMLRRAAALVNGARITLVKIALRGHLLRCAGGGPATIAVMRETNASVLAVDAGRTLLLDRDEMLAEADRARICVVGYAVEEGA
ncbi:MAG: UDP-2,3-diacylglucosamine diphosphatase LpxI [Bryobacteraceae bacterium]